MVETLPTTESGRIVWVVRPTRSLTWREATRWLMAISLIPLMSGMLFLYFGLPYILPFSGLEVGLLWLAFYVVHRAGLWREVVDLSPGTLVIERGLRRPTERREFDPSWVRVELVERGNWRPSALMLRSHGRVMELGSFLTEGERRLLARSLINALKKTR